MSTAELQQKVNLESKLSTLTSFRTSPASSTSRAVSPVHSQLQRITNAL
jgi:hypothetical protein